MVKITIVYSDKLPISIEAVGHSGYEERGKDIVCSAVSVLMFTAMESINEVAKVNLNTEMDEKTAYMKFEIPKDISKKQISDCEIILKTIIIGLKGVARSYKQYVTLKEEVR